MPRYEYSTNNSGGSWWLKDADWKALEAAGWYVKWGGVYFCRSKYQSLADKPAGKPEPCADSDKCPGHRRFDSFAEMEAYGEKGRYMGSASHDATGEFPSMADAIRSWEKATGKAATDDGCNCCGPPHSFSRERDENSNEWEYASGDEIVGVLYPGSPKTLREAAERETE